MNDCHSSNGALIPQGLKKEVLVAQLHHANLRTLNDLYDMKPLRISMNFDIRRNREMSVRILDEDMSL